jgi:probable rRNA maturation factor
MKIYNVRKSGVKIIIRNLQNRIPVNSKKVVKTVQQVLSQEGIKKSGEITLCFVNDAKIKALNLKYLGRNNPTDVIAFDITEPKDKDKIFADIAVSTERAIDNARTFKTSPYFELYLYVIHGILHILGYDDKSKKDKLVMRKREKDILKALNLSP